MEIIQFNFGDAIQENPDLVLCLGYFDGVHLGHQSLINKAIKEGYKTGVMTFDNSPAYILGLIQENHYLTSVADKADILEQMGVDFLYIMHFDKNTISLTKDEFINSVLKPINPRLIYCGEDYAFGARGEGNPKYLSNFFSVHVEPFINDEGKKISSRDIVQLIEKGQMKKAQCLLDRYYQIYGFVAPGLGNGRTMQTPTANLKLDYPYVFPKIGVYMGYADIGFKKYKCLINVGYHPTLQQLAKPIIEVHILDFNGNIYGQTLCVKFVDFIRDEFRFESKEELMAQIQKDIQKTKNSLQ